MHLEPHGNERGAILILTALVLTALLGITALALDASFMYDKRNAFGAAADAAALATAKEYKRAGTAVNLRTFANHSAQLVLKQYGLTVVSGSSNVTSCAPPSNTNQVAVCVNSPP